MNTIDVNYAGKLFKEKKHSDFMKYCLSFEKIEDGDTLDSMAICYRDGKGVEKDLDKAISCFEKAIKNGYIPAASRLAKLYRNEASKKDLQKAIYWNELAAETGDSSAMFNLGYIYRNEKSVMNLAKAVDWYTKAAEKGDAGAMYNLGRLYRNEESFKNIDKAIEWYTKASEHGDVDATYNLGNIYRREQSVRDIHKSIEWHEKAIALGSTDSMLAIAIIYSADEEVKDIGKCIHYYEKGYEHGSTSCMFNLAWVYHYVDSVKDLAKAEYWYGVSGDNGHNRGKYWYAKLALQNKTAQNIEKAYRFLSESALEDVSGALNLLTEESEKGVDVAQFYLGRYYMEKTDIENHEQIALKWYKKSALQGYIPAQNILLINQSAFTSQTVKEIKVETSVIAETTASNSKKLDNITNSLVSMNEKIAEIRKQAFTGNPNTEDGEISSALEKSANIIINTVEDGPCDKINRQTERLISLFGKQTWEKLLPESRKSLVSSAVLLKECEDMPPDFDYSGICITAIVALEKELKRIFSDNYLNFLKARKKTEEWPNILQDEKYYFSLGKMGTLFGYDKENLEAKNNYYSRKMDEYLRTIVKKEYNFKPLSAFVGSNNPYCFVARCLSINELYRCKAAHSGNVSYDDAVDCCYEIYGEASAHIDAKKHSAEIISLLRELYSILK